MIKVILHEETVIMIGYEDKTIERTIVDPLIPPDSEHEATHVLMTIDEYEEMVEVTKGTDDGQ